MEIHYNVQLTFTTSSHVSGPKWKGLWLTTSLKRWHGKSTHHVGLGPTWYVYLDNPRLTWTWATLLVQNRWDNLIKWVLIWNPSHSLDHHGEQLTPPLIHIWNPISILFVVSLPKCLHQSFLLGFPRYCTCTSIFSKTQVPIFSFPLYFVANSDNLLSF